MKYNEMFDSNESEDVVQNNTLFIDESVSEQELYTDSVQHNTLIDSETVESTKSVKNNITTKEKNPNLDVKKHIKRGALAGLVIATSTMGNSAIGDTDENMNMIETLDDGFSNTQQQERIVSNKVESEGVRTIEVSQGGGLISTIARYLEEVNNNSQDTLAQAAQIVFNFAAQNGISMNVFEKIHTGDSVQLQEAGESFVIKDFSLNNKWQLESGELGVNSTLEVSTEKETEDSKEKEIKLPTEIDSPSKISEQEKLEVEQAKTAEGVALEKETKSNNERIRVMNLEQAKDIQKNMNEEAKNFVNRLGIFSKIGLVGDIQNHASDIIKSLDSGIKPSNFPKDLQRLVNVYMDNLDEIKDIDFDKYKELKDDIKDKINKIEGKSLLQVSSMF